MFLKHFKLSILLIGLSVVLVACSPSADLVVSNLNEAPGQCALFTGNETLKPTLNNPSEIAFVVTNKGLVDAPSSTTHIEAIYGGDFNDVFDLPTPAITVNSSTELRFPLSSSSFPNTVYITVNFDGGANETTDGVKANNKVKVVCLN
jgi:hypothetical protein